MHRRDHRSLGAFLTLALALLALLALLAFLALFLLSGFRVSGSLLRLLGTFALGLLILTIGNSLGRTLSLLLTLETLFAC